MVNNNGVYRRNADKTWLHTDPYSATPNLSGRPTSVDSSCPSSAGSAAQFYAQETGIYIPSPGSGSPDRDVRRPHIPLRDSIGLSDYEGGPRRHLIPPPTKIITPAERRAPPMTPRLTDANLAAHTRTTSQQFKAPRYIPSVATSVSVYSQESAPRSHHHLQYYANMETTAEVPIGRRPGQIPNHSDSSSDGHSIPIMRTTAPTRPHQSDRQQGFPSFVHNTALPRDSRSLNAHDFPSAPPKEYKVVRYAMESQVYTPDPHFISYIPAGPTAASNVNVAHPGIRNYVSKRGNAKQKPSASTSSNIYEASSASASVRSLPAIPGRNEHYQLRRKQNRNLSMDGETQSLHSAKSAIVAPSASKRFLSLFRFRRFLPGGNKKNCRNNFSKLDLDGYEVKRYFAKA
ncbi:hypothetical protein JR316_0007493 [Psilocybe cubensis]|nr:hypothetical protein JR316_0007493 [Psilocybe cubensis]KAH9480891.1 hypothetical protein JR316_0007493 [Psilocybe cubensis]